MGNDALLVLLVVGFQPVTTDCHTDKQLEHFAFLKREMQLLP